MALSLGLVTVRSPAQTIPEWMPARTLMFDDAAMAYDPERQRLVAICSAYYGGSSATWEWDGTLWRRQEPSASPSTRQWHAMTYDAGRRRVVLFGGRDGLGQNLADLWEWDGRNWTERTPPAGPAPRYEAILVHDPARARLVLYGGSGAGLFDDTWEFDGIGWVQRTPATTPGPRRNSVAAATPGSGTARTGWSSARRRSRRCAPDTPWPGTPCERGS